MKILFIFPNIDIGGYKNLGIASLIAVAKKSGHQVKLFDTSFINCEKYQSNEVFTDSKTAGEEVFNFTPVNLEGYDYGKKDVDLDMVFSEVIKAFKPDIVALSIFSQEFALGMYLLNIVKGLSSNIINIVGGVHCYADPDGVINNKNVDLVCAGEGEMLFENLLTCLENNGDYSDIAGLWYKKEGQVVKNPAGSYIDINDIPLLDYEEFDDRQFIRVFDGKVYRSADLYLTRGCFERCIYCLFDKIYGTHEDSRKIRILDIDVLISGIERLVKKHNLNFIRFQDSTFLTVPEKYFAKFAEEYKKRIGLPFVIDSVPQSVTLTKVKLLKEMNCKSISIGVETGNEEYRMKYLQKNVSNKQITNAINIINGCGIRTVSFILLGFPFETRSLIFETIKLCREARVASPNVGFVYPFKGSKLRDYVLKEKLFDENIEKNDSAQYTRNRPVITNKNISADEYIGIYRTFLFYCKFPERYYKEIEIAERLDSVGDEVYNKFKNIYIEQKLYNTHYQEGEYQQEAETMAVPSYPLGFSNI